MTLQGDMFFAITAAAALFCLAIAAALVWAQGRELKRKDEIIARSNQRTDHQAGLSAAFDHDGDGRPGGSRKRV